MIHTYLKWEKEPEPVKEAGDCLITMFILFCGCAFMALIDGVLPGGGWKTAAESFCMTFPIMCICFIFSKIKHIFKVGGIKNGRATTVVSIAFCIAAGVCGWFMGGKQSVVQFSGWCAGQARHYNELGNRSYKRNTESGYKKAKRDYLIAVWIEKYLDINDKI